MRFWREFRHPRLKCDRVGHKDQTKRVRIRKEESGYRVVAADYMADLTTCKRCGRRLKPENLELRDRYGGCTMPQHMWDEIEKYGYTIITG